MFNIARHIFLLNIKLAGRWLRSKRKYLKTISWFESLYFHISEQYRRNGGLDPEKKQIKPSYDSPHIS